MKTISSPIAIALVLFIGVILVGGVILWSYNPQEWNFNGWVIPIKKTAKPIENNVEQTKEQKCITSGGTVNEITCYCSSTQDFFNSCLIGGCACAPNPAYARQIKTCDCGGNKCFDGATCVNRNF